MTDLLVYARNLSKHKDLDPRNLEPRKEKKPNGGPSKRLQPPKDQSPGPQIRNKHGSPMKKPIKPGSMSPGKARPGMDWGSAPSVQQQKDKPADGRGRSPTKMRKRWPQEEERDVSPSHQLYTTNMGLVATSKFESKEAGSPKKPPPKADIFRPNDDLLTQATLFRKFYDRGDLPITLEHKGATNKVGWKVEIESLDYHHYLPVFFDGIREKHDPYKFLAREGLHSMLLRGGSKILPVIPQLIIPIKNALNTKDPDTVSTMLVSIQRLCKSAELVGEALVPYYRQLLPIMNLFRDQNLNIGDRIEYSQRRNLNLGDIVEQTLNTLELHGGEDAFINIKYMVPTYESCVLN